MSKLSRLDIESHIDTCQRRFGGAVPRDVILVWYGYLTALLDQELLEVEDYDKLRSLLGEVENNPAGGLMFTWLDKWDDSPIA